MPVQYTSILQEHMAVRSGLGVFDISHMGEIFVEGKDALAFLQKICTNDISKCGTAKAIYSHLCNPQGGVIDDIFVYCLEFPIKYLVVVNASTADKDHQWMLKNALPGVVIRNESDHLSMIAVQGPRAAAVVSKIFKVPERHQVAELSFKNKNIFICRTGYTGEDGVEIVAPNEIIENLLDSVMTEGREFGIIPCGLGARDTLRLEAGYLLYGNDIDDDHTPLEAGVPWVVKFLKGDFIGKTALEKQKNEGSKQKLTAFKLTERGIPRHGFKILCDGRDIGILSSGTFSPSLKVGIAMGYVPGNCSGAFSIECNGKPVPAEVTKLPFFSGSKN